MMAMPVDKTRDAGGIAPPATVKVWDLFVRIFHWSLVASFAVAWITADELDRLHEWTGYAAAALVSARILWGFVGTKHARFSDFVRSPWAVLGYLGDIMRGKAHRHLGHNPAGGAMIIALIIGILGLGLTGWMMSTDAFWGVDWVEEVHEVLANGMLVLVALHLIGVLSASLLHGENLIAAMITGRKRREEPDQ